jgi:SecD/SecF fusion protein
MQGKGLIKFFFVLMFIVTALQFLFMYPTSKVEKDADAYASEVAAQIADEDAAITAQKEARVAYIDSMSSEKVLTIPGLTSYTYDDLKNRQLAFGLD